MNKCIIKRFTSMFPVWLFYSNYQIIFKAKISEKHFLNYIPKLLLEINNHLLRENVIVNQRFY